MNTFKHPHSYFFCHVFLMICHWAYCCCWSLWSLRAAELCPSCCQCLCLCCDSSFMLTLSLVVATAFWSSSHLRILHHELVFLHGVTVVSAPSSSTAQVDESKRPAFDRADAQKVEARFVDPWAAEAKMETGCPPEQFGYKGSSNWWGHHWASVSCRDRRGFIWD